MRYDIKQSKFRVTLEFIIMIWYKTVFICAWVRNFSYRKTGYCSVSRCIIVMTFTLIF